MPKQTYRLFDVYTTLHVQNSTLPRFSAIPGLCAYQPCASVRVNIWDAGTIVNVTDTV